MLLNIILVICISLSEANETTTKEPTEPLFPEKVYPRYGDIPILNRKIFRARRVSIIEHPYIVSIRRNYTHYLVGSLLTINVIITVAHPLYKVPVYELGVVVGENFQDRGTSIHTVLFIIIHKEFDPFTLRHDIALLRFYNDKTYRETVKPVPILKSTVDLDKRLGFVTGWGRCDWRDDELCLPRSSVYYPDEIIDTMLRTATFLIRDPEPYCEGYLTNGLIIYPGMYCIGPAREDIPLTSCLGSPGSPLVVNGKLVGIASWGFGCCYPTDLPVIYTDVRYFYEWLVKNLAIMTNITNDDLYSLYVATKAFSLAELTYPSIIDSHDTHGHPDKPLQVIPLDDELVYLDGKIYDLRDFYDGRKYHPQKLYMYETIRKKVSRSQKKDRATTIEPFEEIVDEYVDDDYLLMYHHNDDDLPND